MWADYVALGQPVPTSAVARRSASFAGFLAEAAKTAAKSRQNVARKGTLFLFDEPTTGLHLTTSLAHARPAQAAEAGHCSSSSSTTST